MNREYMLGTALNRTVRYSDVEILEHKEILGSLILHHSPKETS